MHDFWMPSCLTQRFLTKKNLFIIIIFFVIIGFIAGPVQSFIILRLDAQSAPCDQLPSYVQAHATYNDHLDMIGTLENLSPGFVTVFVVERCLGKGEIVIYYDAMNTRNQIKALLGSSFYGIPYVMFNT